jgi:hypothetical protein
MGMGVGFIEFSCCLVQYFAFLCTFAMGRSHGIGALVGNLNFGVNDGLPHL